MLMLLPHLVTHLHFSVVQRHLPSRWEHCSKMHFVLVLVRTLCLYATAAFPCAVLLLLLQLHLLGYKQELGRHLSSFHNFATTFSFLSPITGNRAGQMFPLTTAQTRPLSQHKHGGTADAAAYAYLHLKIF